MNLLPFDELHRIEEMLWDAKKEKEEVLNSLFDFFLYSYVLGKTAAEDMLGKELKADTADKAQESVAREFDGKTWNSLVSSYLDTNDIGSVVRVAETEMHRDYNTGVFDTAKALGATTKTWQTMLDNKVRDPHWLLEGVTVPIDEMFFVDGYEARFPGDFGTPELDCNCRCYLEVK